MLEYWYQALHSSHGVCIRTSDREHTRAKLYAARKEACDEALDALAVTFSPTVDNEIWIVKK